MEDAESGVRNLYQQLEKRWTIISRNQELNIEALPGNDVLDVNKALPAIHLIIRVEAIKHWKTNKLSEAK